MSPDVAGAAARFGGLCSSRLEFCVETRVAARGLEEASRGEALKMCEDARKRKFLAARGEAARERNGIWTNRDHAWSLGGRDGTLQNASSTILTGVASSSS